MELEYVTAAGVIGTGDASVGARTIGDISMTVGDNGKNVWTFEYASADVNGEGDASVGVLTMGDISIVAGDDKTGWFSAYVSAYAMLTLVMHRFPT